MLEIFLHYLYISCPTAAFCVGVITHSPQAGHRGSEGPRLPSWPLLSKWTWQAWNAGRRWMPKAPMFSVASQRQRQQPLVKTNGSDHGCQAPHSLGRLTRKGTKLFAGNSNRTVPRLPRQPFPTHTKAWANTGAAISSPRSRARAGPGRPSRVPDGAPHHHHHHRTPGSCAAHRQPEGAEDQQGGRVNSRASGRRPCLRPGVRMCGELASRNAGADLNSTSGKSEPVGLEGAGRIPEIPPLPPTPDGFLAHA